MGYIIDDANKVMKIFLKIMFNEDELKRFVLHCGDVNCKDELGRTMLHYAVLNENLSAVKILLDANARVDEEDNDLRTPMHYLAVIGNTSIAKYILEYTKVSYKEDLYGQTPLCLAQWRGNFSMVHMLMVSSVSRAS